MKDYGWDIKYGFWLLLTFIASYPIFLFEPLIILFVVAIVLLVLGSKQLIRQKNLKKWVETSGLLLETDLGVYRVSHGQFNPPVKHYYPLAFFSYCYNEKEYKSNEYAFDYKSIWSTEQEAVKNIIKELETREALNVFVNPKNPTEAVLNRQVSANRLSHYWALFASGCILFVIGIILWIYS
ncbi:MAG: hypothetical protein B7X28_03950 [Halothiobacillus sp. 13-55-253]|jgi:hypothetical protein|nr:MAG: hypothetical protein B7X28_03950 [Halothiobacillus sp. 13-55-253]